MLLLAYFLYLLNAADNTHVATEFIIVVSCITAVAVPALTALIVCRRRFYRLSKRNRLALATLCCCLPFAALVGMIVAGAFSRIY
jgi:hypothetical protein